MLAPAYLPSLQHPTLLLLLSLPVSSRSSVELAWEAEVWKPVVLLQEILTQSLRGHGSLWLSVVGLGEVGGSTQISSPCTQNLTTPSARAHRDKQKTYTKYLRTR